MFKLEVCIFDDLLECFLLLLGVRRVSNLFDPLVPAILVSLVESLNAVAVTLSRLVVYVSQALLCKLAQGDRLGVLCCVNVEDSEKAKKGNAVGSCPRRSLARNGFSLC
ncbi:MAG: hypothetical protein IIW78_02060 [Clostridia bacterium]|nr:hypothetical protein [Clostridia bacterium]